jgi:hypothetical protein
VVGRGGRKNRARFRAEFILSGQGKILRFAQNDSEGLGMTGGQRGIGLDRDDFRTIPHKAVCIAKLY